MSWTSLLPLAIVLSSLVPGLIIFTLREEQQRLRVTLNLAGVALKVVLVAAMLIGVSDGLTFRFSLPFLPGAPLILQGDALSLLFVTLSTVLWLATTVYAIGYLEGSPLRSRFFGYFSLCVSATVGLALAGNLVTFLLFYELLTLATFPLVVHRGTPESLRAGRVYLAYTLGGGTLVLMGVALLHSLVGSPDFQPGGYLGGLVEERWLSLRVAFALLVLGWGEGRADPAAWLAAQGDGSAGAGQCAAARGGGGQGRRLRHRAGGLRRLRRRGDGSAGAGPAAALAGGGDHPLRLAARLQQSELKRRLAYSTVSQVSYITLGVALLGPLAVVGGLVHLAHQGLMKVTLFYCAGNFAETLGVQPSIGCTAYVRLSIDRCTATYV